MPSSPNENSSTSSAIDAIGLPFAVFRASEAIPFPLAEVLASEGTKSETGTPAPEFAMLVDRGILDGGRISLLFSRPGLTMTHVWFKSGFPLPRHSHGTDCSYFIISGSLRIGTEELGPGDGFFVGTDVPYSYVPGNGGVEVLEFRTTNVLDFKPRVNNPAWWDKAAARLDMVTPQWPQETAPPSGIKIGT